MQIIRTNSTVKKTKNPKNIYKISIEFEDETRSSLGDLDRVINLANMYTEYYNLLQKDWNSWCNLEPQMLVELFIKHKLIPETGSTDEVFNFICEEGIWAEKNEHYLAPLYELDIKVTHYDENGLEWKCDIVS